MTTAGSPTVTRRLLAAELRRLRGARTGGAVAKALGWSAAKVSRFELGQTSFPIEEVEKLLDFYRVPKPQRGQLLELAADANERGWWEAEYADVLTESYAQFIGLEAGAVSEAEWQNEAVPGLLQTEEYARHVIGAFQSVMFVPPGHVERRVQARIIRQLVVTEREPPVKLSVVIDESVLLRRVGSSDLMSEQLRHIAEMAERPNVEVRVLPLQSQTALMADSFIMLGFTQQDGAGPLTDVVSTESQGNRDFSIEGETDTYAYRLIFEGLAEAALGLDESHDYIIQTARRVWS